MHYGSGSPNACTHIPMPLAIYKTHQELKAALPALKTRGRVALIPTMGALHAGHMALVAEARRHAQSVIVYIFVNPAQFSPHEDLARYPRTLEADIEKCQEAGVDAIYAPSVEDVYPPGFDAVVSAGSIATDLEGASRPGHFDGVATVLTKMFLRILPDVAIFGEKDFQQLAVIKKFVSDLDIPVEIIGLPTVREADGLALSSRNAYLSAEERAIAPNLHRILKETAQRLHATDNEAILIEATQKLLDAGFLKVDYLAVRDAEHFSTLTLPHQPARLLAAAWLGNTRLIDNLPINSI